MEERILFFGDICPTHDTLLAYFNGGPSLFANVMSNNIASANSVVANLECVLTNKQRSIKKAGPVLMSPSEYANIIKQLGFHALSLANNHIRDCGTEGVLSTIRACEKYRLECFGVGANKEKAKTHFEKEVCGKRIIVYALSEREFNHATDQRWGANAFDPYESFDDIRELKKNADFLVILYHGGIEYYPYPSPLLQKKCRKMVECGADLVLCQHSHCIGSFEKYLHGEILYGQGNSIFGYRNGNESWNHGLLVELQVSTQVSVTYKLIETNSDGIVDFAKDLTEYNQFLERSSKLSDSAFLQKEWEAFCQKHKALYMPMLYGLSTNVNRLNRLFHNKLIECLYTRMQKNVTHNLIRCDAHQEVLDTILSEDDFE